MRESHRPNLSAEPRRIARRFDNASQNSWAQEIMKMDEYALKISSRHLCSVLCFPSSLKPQELLESVIFNSAFIPTAQPLALVRLIASRTAQRWTRDLDLAGLVALRHKLNSVSIALGQDAQMKNWCGVSFFPLRGCIAVYLDKRV